MSVQDFVIHRAWAARGARAAALAAVLALLLWAAPAQACGCGGYIPHDGDAFVSREQALLRWDGHTEDLVMTLGVNGKSKEAAVVLPVPSRATVQLGEARVWKELDDLTKPLVKVEKRIALPPLGAGAAAPMAGAGPVTLLDRQTLGPFEVSNLAATDANALVDWLQQNGYQLSPGLGKALEPYIAQGWYYVAVRLRPGAGDSLGGELDPLWVTFPANELVYPMRASANARADQSVVVYVLADHRVSKTESFGGSHIAFADWIQPNALGSDSALKPYVNRKLFLTKFEETVHPSEVNADFVFADAPTDEAYHDTIVRYEDDYVTGIALLLGAMCLLGAIIIAVPLGLIYLLFRVLRRTPHPA